MKNKKSNILSIIIFLIFAMGKVSAMNLQNEELKGIGKELQKIWNPVDVNVEEIQEELDDLRKQEALKKLKEILGIKGAVKEEIRNEIPPQFMMELYHEVTDSEGYTSGKNPYNAKIVRSFIEKDSSSLHFYKFNISGLEQNESVLEAELHLFRKRSSPNSMHPSVLSSPYYLIRVYQVLPDRSLEEPDLHRLLNVHYVGAYASGWQVFNVKQAVLSWLSGVPNLGLLVTASTIFGDKVTVDFSRREDQPHDKQPILVLFNNDGTEPIKPENPPQDEKIPNQEDHELEDDAELENAESMLKNEMEDSERSRNKRHKSSGSVKKGQPEEVPDNIIDNRPTHFRRVKKTFKHSNDENDIIQRRRRYPGFVTVRRSMDKVLTSMDVYRRAMLREKLNLKNKDHATPITLEKRSISSNHHQNTDDSFRIKRDSSTTTPKPNECRKTETEPCAKRELYVNFRDIGLSTIIAPEGYAAYQCRGHCRSPLSQDQKPTNHATIQGIIHKMNLASNQDVDAPCCVPVNLSSISILYHDDERDGVVLKSYTDMAVVSCGCR